MNRLDPDNLIFVPKNRFTNFILGCSSSVFVLILGFIVIFLIYSFVGSLNQS